MPNPSYTELQERIKKLEDLVNSMLNASSVNSDFAKVLDRGTIRASSKVNTSENQSVNEAGSGVWSLLKGPDGFDEVTINGATHYYPYYL